MKEKLGSFVLMYIRWIAQSYSLINRANSSLATLRIISEKSIEEKKETIFVIQLSGKNIFPKFRAIDLFDDKSLFLNFSELDKQKILQALPTKQSPILYRITSRTYDKHSKQFYFTIEFVNENKKENLTVSEIIQKFSRFAGFNEKDSFLIGLEIGKQGL